MSTNLLDRFRDLGLLAQASSEEELEVHLGSGMSIIGSR